jgi:hypothetical protein
MQSCAATMFIINDENGCYFNEKRGVVMLNAIFNNISVISWWPILLVEETVLPGKKLPTCRKSRTNFIT